MKRLKSFSSLTIIHQSNCNRFRFGTWLSDPVDVLCPDTKLILTLWKKVLEMNRTLFKQLIFPVRTKRHSESMQGVGLTLTLQTEDFSSCSLLVRLGLGRLA